MQPTSLDSNEDNTTPAGERPASRAGRAGAPVPSGLPGASSSTVVEQDLSSSEGADAAPGLPAASGAWVWSTASPLVPEAPPTGSGTVTTTTAPEGVSRGRRWPLVTGMATVLAGGLVLAAFTRQGPGAESPPTRPSPAPIEQVAAPRPPAVGDESWRFRVTGVATPGAIVAGGQGAIDDEGAATPKDGYRFLAIDVELKDLSGDTTEVESDQLPVRDRRGRVTLPEAIGDTDSLLDADVLSLGDTGCIDCYATSTRFDGAPVVLRLVYVVPAEASGLTLGFRDLPPVPIGLEADTRAKA